MQLDFNLNDEGDVLIRFKPNKKRLAEINLKRLGGVDMDSFFLNDEDLEQDEFNYDLEGCSLFYFYPNENENHEDRVNA